VTDSRPTDRRGLPRSITLGIAALTTFLPGAIVFGYIGVIGRRWQETLELPRSSIASLMFFTLASFSTGLTAAGFLESRYGRRLVSLVGTACSAGSMLLVVHPSGLLGLRLWGVIASVGTAFVYLPALATAQRLFPDRRGLATGVVAAIYSGGAALTSSAMASLLRSHGEAYLAYLIAGTTAGLGILCAFIALPGRDRSRATAAHAAAKQAGASLRQIVGSRSFLFLLLALAIQGGASIALITHATEYGSSISLGPSEAVLLIVGFNAGSALSRLFMGGLSDAIGRTRTMAIASGMCACAYLALAHIAGLVPAVLLASVVGWSFGTLFSVAAPLVAESFGDRNFAIVFALSMTGFGLFAGLIGPTVAAVILDANQGRFLVPFLYLGGLSAIAAILVLAIKPLATTARAAVSPGD